MRKMNNTILVLFAIVVCDELSIAIFAKVSLYFPRPIVVFPVLCYYYLIKS